MKTIASISRNDGTLNLIGPGLTRASSAKDDALRDEECAYSLLTSMGRRTVHRIGWHINRIGYRIVSRDGSLRRGRPELCIKRRTEHHLGHIRPQRHHETVSPGRTRNEPEIGSRPKPLAERRAKCLPLVDLAGLIRSFHNAAPKALRTTSTRNPNVGNSPELGPRVEQWYRTAHTAFLRGDRTTVGQEACSPRSQEEFSPLLNVHMLDKAVCELSCELNSRPDSAGLPLTNPLQSVETWCHCMDEHTR